MSTRLHVLALCLLSFAIREAGVPPAAAAPPPRTLRAGAHAIDITPLKFPVLSNGSMSSRTATAAHDPLHARCLVLDDGSTRIAIVIVDNCLLPREIVDEARRLAAESTHVPAENMLVAATHTHTAVSVTPAFQTEVEPGYGAFLAERIAEGVALAEKNLEPARIGWAIGNNPDQVFNRRWFMRSDVANADPFDHGTDRVRMNPPRGDASLLIPAGPIDPEVSVVAVQSREGRSIAVLANYSLHYVGGVPGGMLSADYFGEFARQFTRLVGATEAEGRPPFVAVMSNGTSGDVNNIDFYGPGMRQEPFEQIRLVATDVAESALVAYNRVRYHDWVPLRVANAEVELGVRRPTKDELVWAKRILAEAGPGPYSDRRAIYALESLTLAEYPATVQARIQAIRIGDLGIASSPCETFVETGLAIKKQSPLRPTFVIELANGYNGYLPTPEQHELGGYETWRARSSYLATDAEPKIRATILELLEQVAKE